MIFGNGRLVRVESILLSCFSWESGGEKTNLGSEAGFFERRK